MRHLLRRRERILMEGRCTVTRGTAGTQVYTDLPCTAVPAGMATRKVEAGGDEISLHLYDVTTPLRQAGTLVDVRKDDVVEITTSADGELVGRYLIVLQATHDEFITNRRLTCQEMR